VFIYSKQYKSTLTLPTFIRNFIAQIANLLSRIFNELACPARFERATSALEAVKMRLNNSKNNDIEVFKLGVQYTPRTLVLGGIAWI
jgi:hypothetical protein